MTSSNTAKVLSYEDIDELNQQVVERPVTIFQNLNAPAPCEEDKANPEPILNIEDKVCGFIKIYVIIFLFWPSICAWLLVAFTCMYISGDELSANWIVTIGAPFFLINLFPGIFFLIN